MADCKTSAIAWKHYNIGGITVWHDVRGPHPKRGDVVQGVAVSGGRDIWRWRGPPPPIPDVVFPRLPTEQERQLWEAYQSLTVSQATIDHSAKMLDLLAQDRPAASIFTAVAVAAGTFQNEIDAIRSQAPPWITGDTMPTIEVPDASE